MYALILRVRVNDLEPTLLHELHHVVTLLFRKKEENHLSVVIKVESARWLNVVLVQDLTQSVLVLLPVDVEYGNGSTLLLDLQTPEHLFEAVLRVGGHSVNGRHSAHFLTARTA